VSDEPLILSERRGSVALLTLNRPPVNALSRTLLDAILHAVEGCARDHDVRAVVLTGGRRAFSAGADVREIEPLSDAGARDWISHGQRVLNEIGSINRPVVAAIEGFCLGGGLELALACHMRVAGRDAELGLPEIRLGIIPGFGGTQRLPRLVGSGAALELMLTGDSIGAERALAVGLVNRVVEAGRAVEAAVELATRVASRSATAAAAILRVYHGGVDHHMRQDLTRELDEVAAAVHSLDGREGLRAFVEKRSPIFEAPPPSYF
jgi:enoyl-CoA hydratase/carnithine racemase